MRDPSGFLTYVLAANLGLGLQSGLLPSFARLPCAAKLPSDALVNLSYTYVFTKIWANFGWAGLPSGAERRHKVHNSCRLDGQGVVELCFVKAVQGHLCNRS